jgi:acyl-CoA synthetase (NDP forming)
MPAGTNRAVTIRNLNRLVAPRSVALVGASDRPGSVGRTMVRNLLGGFRGRVMPVNPKHRGLEGLTCFPDVATLPEVPDLAVIATPAPTLLGLIAALGRRGCKAVVVTSVIDWAVARGLGFSHLVSMGEMLDVDFADMLDVLADDPDTRAILLYVETIGNARKFMSAARAAACGKPVIAIKAGRHEEGARAAISHTGALAGADAVYDAAFRRAGVLRVYGLSELFAAIETLGNVGPIEGERLAILTNGGGIGILAADALSEAGGHLAEISPGRSPGWTPACRRCGREPTRSTSSATPMRDATQ